MAPGNACNVTATEPNRDPAIAEQFPEQSAD